MSWEEDRIDELTAEVAALQHQLAEAKRELQQEREEKIKDAPLDDLKKAAWYIQREIAKREKEIAK